MSLSVGHPWHLSRSPLCAIYKGINALYWPSIIKYKLSPPHSVLYWPSTQFHHLVPHSWANWIEFWVSFQILSECRVKHNVFSKHHDFVVELGLNFEVIIWVESCVTGQNSQWLTKKMHNLWKCWTPLSPSVKAQNIFHSKPQWRWRSTATNCEASKACLPLGREPAADTVKSAVILGELPKLASNWL